MYEYRVISRNMVNPSVLETELNGLALQGFRLAGVAGVSAVTGPAERGITVCIMERVVQEVASDGTEA